MQELIRKAGVLIEALPYIQAFRGETIVIKFGGSAMEEPRQAEGILKDVAFMECVGMRPVIVHGGGKAISRGMQKAGIAPVFVEGLRVTCERTIAVVARVLKEEVNPEIVRTLERMGAAARRVDGERVFRVTRKTGTHAETGRALDWGFVGEPGEVDAGPVTALLSEDVIPVVTPLGADADGCLHNINADTAAAALSGALRARKLVYLSDVPGVLRDMDDETSILSTVEAGAVATLIERGVVAGGMLPKVQSGMAALRHGVQKVHMVDGRLPHSLLLEIFTDKGVGTEIVNG